jgi:hypothetical protein
MSRRTWIVLAVVVLVLAIGAELGVRRWNTPKGCVQIVNQGDAMLENLVVTYAETKIPVGSVAASQSTSVWFTPAGKGTLSLEFQQKGSPLNGFQVADFDPAQHRRDGFKLMLVVKSNQVERFMEEDENGSSEWNLPDRFKEWIRWGFAAP